MKNILLIISKSIKDNGIHITLKKIFLLIHRNIKIFRNLYYLKLSREKYFLFNNEKLNYFYHFYNKTYENERIIEIPIILNLISSLQIDNYYELGNVLTNYGIKGHQVLDKYDLNDNIINEDIAYYKPSNKIKNLISISTLEHIGWDEDERGYNKVSLAINNIKNNILAPGGLFLFTIPVGYNPYLDDYIVKNKSSFHKIYTLIRINKNNEWVETNFDSCINQKFNYPFINANGLIIGIILSN